MSGYTSVSADAWHRLKQFREKVALAAGLSVLSTDDEIVEWVATLHRAAGRPRVYGPVEPGAAAIKAGLDAVEGAMGPEDRKVPDLLEAAEDVLLVYASDEMGRTPALRNLRLAVDAAMGPSPTPPWERGAELLRGWLAKRRAQEREALADTIAARLYSLGMCHPSVRGPILAVLESCDDPGVEEKPERVFVDPSDLPDRQLDPAFPGEVTLRDDPDWQAAHAVGPEGEAMDAETYRALTTCDPREMRPDWADATVKEWFTDPGRGLPYERKLAGMFRQAAAEAYGCTPEEVARIRAATLAIVHLVSNLKDDLSIL